MADIVLINPRFKVSYWGLEHALPLLGKRANMPLASLPLLAALTPPGHTVTLLDENIEDIDLDRCARADIVGLTGMVVQRERMRQLLTELKRRGAFLVVGGPWATVKEDDFEGLSEVIFVGEAEVSRRLVAGRAQAAVRASRADRHDDGPHAAVRPAQDATLPVRQRPVLPRLPVSMRVLRHHRDVRAEAEAQDLRAGPR